ncbi:YfbU family protein [Cryobacterium sp. Hz7]|uniref:YfbU family protein n=1 Tax=Cryobacterium sp. Hz7 TaxID=1259166 RepID=UPI00106BA8B8|nr:YfbU family protein [Cryobacterium sp. Hz7]TFB59032.1 YfbU family protein [Cryobacterium sp. Hz7]
MAVLNVRVDDHVYEQLKIMADNQGISLSEHVRDLLLESVVPIGGEPERRHGDAPVPDSLRLMDRQVLSLLHRILARVLPDDENDDDGNQDDQLQMARNLEHGFTLEYWREAAGFETELSRRDSQRLTDVLQMFRVIIASVKHHEREGAPVDDALIERLSFRGFDHNDALEGHMARYVQHLVSTGRWEELKPYIQDNDGGNSHMQMLDVYTRMLAEYRRIMDGRARGSSMMDAWLLSPEELSAIEDATTHPSRRGK